MAFATEDSLERLISSVEHAGNQKTLRKYLKERRANGAKIGTQVNEGTHLRHFAYFLGDREFASVARDDIVDFVTQSMSVRKWRNFNKQTDEWITTTRKVKLGDSTLAMRKTVVKCFMRWLRGTEAYPPEVAWMSTTREGDALPVPYVLTREDLLAMIDAEDHVQGKAILATLYDSGCRASEFTSLRIRNVTLDEYGAVLTLPKGAQGLKTGARRIRVLNCTPYLRAWLNAHPKKRDPNAPLWISYANRNHGDPLSSHALYTFVVRAGERASLDKEVWPHLFRHSRATECAKEGWPEAEMRNLFGWTRNSDMPSHYVHMSGKDYEESMLRRAGKLGADRKHQPALQPRMCQCGHENAATADYCEKRECGKPLTVPAAERRERAQGNALIEALRDDPAALEKLAAVMMEKAMATVSRRP